MTGQRHLKPREATAMLVHTLVEAGFENVGEQVDVVVATLRLRFFRGTREDDLLVLEAMRVLGCSESKIWAVFQEWAWELDRDVYVIFEHCWAPTFDNHEED